MDTRVLMSGNLAGVAYTYAKYLRRMNVDVSLYLWNWEMKKDTRNPMKTDTECKTLPDWVHTFTDTRFIFGEYRRKARDFDIVHAFNTDPIYAQFTGKPFISHPVGTDAREYAFGKGFHPALLRRAYRKNDSFFFGSLDYYSNVLRKIRVRNPIYIDAIQQMDIGKFEPRPVPERGGADELFFYPSSHTPGKGASNLIKAFAKYVRTNNSTKKMIMIEWGEDAAKSKMLVNDLGISDWVIFKKWLDKQDVFNHMKCADIVFDQFIVPSSSTVQREACALGKPVVKFMDDSWFKEYDKMPFIPAGSEKELFDVMVDYHENPEKFRAIGVSAKSFVEKYYDWRYITGKIIKTYESILSG
ncbi:MAG: glycosyltransferase family 4 protein [Thermoplasmata archaeon]